MTRVAFFLLSLLISMSTLLAQVTITAASIANGGGAVNSTVDVTVPATETATLHFELQQGAPPATVFISGSAPVSNGAGQNFQTVVFPLAKKGDTIKVVVKYTKENGSTYTAEATKVL